MKRLFSLCLLLVFLFTGCSPQQASETVPATALPSAANEARATLVDFLTLLHTGKYAEAVPHYGGEYESLQVFNPQIDPADKAALWAWACDNQLLLCLEVRSATLKNQAGDSFIFQVEFSNPDGSLFVRGPCCGATETEMPSVTQFEYTVRRNAEQRFVVLNTPPYVP